MNSTDMVTDFKVREDFFETPMGSFSYHGPAAEACKTNDLDPALCITHRVEMATVHSLVKALNVYCGHLAEEYNFSLDFDLIPESGYKAKGPASLIPEKFWHLIAFAVEGGSEGYYVHFGALTNGDTRSNQYMEFGLAKTYSSESAYELAKQTSRFLAAALWN